MVAEPGAVRRWHVVVGRHYRTGQWFTTGGDDGGAVLRLGFGLSGGVVVLRSYKVPGGGGRPAAGRQCNSMEAVVLWVAGGAEGAEAGSRRRKTGERSRMDVRARGGGRASMRWWTTTFTTGGQSRRKTKDGVARFPHRTIGGGILKGHSVVFFSKR
jgi:hypothetical protein